MTEKSKLWNKRIVIYLSIITFIILILFMWNWDNEPQGERKILSNNTKTETKRYGELKKDNLVFFDKYFDSNISVVFCEYQNYNEKEALIIRCDSVTSILSQSNTDMVNSYHKKNIPELSSSLLSLIDDHIYKISTEEWDGGFFKIRKKGVTVFVRTNEGKVLEFSINNMNKNTELNKEITALIIEIIHEIGNPDLSINELIPKQRS